MRQTSQSQSVLTLADEVIARFDRKISYKLFLDLWLDKYPKTAQTTTREIFKRELEEYFDLPQILMSNDKDVQRFFHIRRRMLANELASCLHECKRTREVNRFEDKGRRTEDKGRHTNETTDFNVTDESTVLNGTELNLEGFVNFRLATYRLMIKHFLAEKVEGLFAAMEAEQLGQMLQRFVSGAGAGTGMLHVVFSENEICNVLSCELDEIAHEIDECDVIVHLIEQMPAKIILHRATLYCRHELLRLLLRVFGNRIYLCAGCALCVD